MEIKPWKSQVRNHSLCTVDMLIPCSSFEIGQFNCHCQFSWLYAPSLIRGLPILIRSDWWCNVWHHAVMYSTSSVMHWWYTVCHYIFLAILWDFYCENFFWPILALVTQWALPVCHWWCTVHHQCRIVSHQTDQMLAVLYSQCRGRLPSTI